MDQTSGTNPTDAPPAQSPQESLPVEQPAEARPGFRSRGQARRRARFLRRARELAYRDLGGLVFNLHRFGQRNDALVLAKLGTLSHIDRELRAIETTLGERRPVTVLREAGITACPRCAAIHGSEDRYCPNCGLPMSRHADLPVAGAPAGDTTAAPVTQAAPVIQAGPQTLGAPLSPATSVSPGIPTTPNAPATSGAPSPSTPPTPVGSVTPGDSPPATGAVWPPAGTGRQDGDAPGAPAEAANDPESPATAQHAAAGGSGRSPVPPFSRQAERETSPPSTSGPEEPTEIIRPQAPGS